jgi:hypothetical protein
MSNHPLERGHSTPEETQFIERMVERKNMKKAYDHVIRNKGAAGIDNMPVESLKTYLQEKWPEIKEQLVKGEYKPRPVRRVEIPKPGGGRRLLGIPTVLDRVIQQAIYQILSPIFEPTFSDNSYGFRPERNAHQAIKRAKEYQTEGKKWVMDMDLAKFFDEVNHDILMSKTVFRAGRGRNLQRFITEDLNPILRGWINYFRIAEVKTFAEDIDGWVRRRLRLILWKQWKKPWTRRKRLIEAGLPEERAVMSAFNRRGSWWNSGASHMNDAFRKKFFDRVGLVSMLDELYNFRIVNFGNRLGT